MEEELEDVEFCVIIGKEIKGGCEQEFCDGLDSCPYFDYREED